ncbi:MAG: hypothetical protein V7708_17335 [Oceanicoccus sp.]
MNRIAQVTFTCVLVLLITACASGSSIVTGVVRDPIDPSVVKLYVEPPGKYEVIGIVKASSDAGWTEQGSTDYAVEELKEQAARLGANGVLLVSTGQNISSVVTGNSSSGYYSVPVSAQTMSGKAIYIPE